VLDFTAMIAGPMATAILGEQGADVIKIEPPHVGDPGRQIGFGRGEISSLFASSNLGKRSLGLDVMKPAGRRAFERLVATADVFVQNYRPGVMQRMGIDESTLRKIHPALIYVSLSGYGEGGPYAKRSVIDSVMQAVSGTAATQADSTGTPRLVQTAVCDKATAWTAAQAVTAALFARDRGAGGQHVKISMLAASVAFMWVDGMQRHSYQLPPGEAIPKRVGYLDMLRSKDGWLMVSVITQAHFEAFCRACDRGDLLSDPKLVDNQSRFENLGYLSGRIQEVVGERTNEELGKVFDSADVCYGFGNSLADLHQDPQVIENDCILEIEHPTGKARHTRGAARFGGTPTQDPGPAPLCGEHSEELLSELGLSVREIDELREEGVIA